MTRMTRKMSVWKKQILLGLVAALIFSLQAEASSKVPGGLADFSLGLLREAVQEGKGENILISPDSILTALAMVEKGAAGSTLAEMQGCLGGKKLEGFLTKLHNKLTGSSFFTYQAANALWYKKGVISLKKSYQKKVKASFGAEVKGAAFDGETVKEMNA